MGDTFISAMLWRRFNAQRRSHVQLKSLFVTKPKCISTVVTSIDLLVFVSVSPCSLLSIVYTEFSISEYYYRIEIVSFAISRRQATGKSDTNDHDHCRNAYVLAQIRFKRWKSRPKTAFTIILLAIEAHIETTASSVSPSRSAPSCSWWRRRRVIVIHLESEWNDMHIKNDVPTNSNIICRHRRWIVVSEWMVHETEMVVGQLYVYSPAFSISIPSVIIPQNIRHQHAYRRP